MGTSGTLLQWGKGDLWWARLRFGGGGCRTEGVRLVEVLSMLGWRLLKDLSLLTVIVKPHLALLPSASAA